MKPQSVRDMSEAQRAALADADLAEKDARTGSMRGAVYKGITNAADALVVTPSEVKDVVGRIPWRERVAQVARSYFRDEA